MIDTDSRYLNCTFKLIFRERARGRGEDGGGTWWGKIRSVTPAVPDNVPLLRTEVVALEELSRFLFLEAHELQNALERMNWSKTCQVKCSV